MAEKRFVNRALLGALAIAAWFSTTWTTKETSEHPVQSIILASLVASPLLLLISKLYPRDSKRTVQRRLSDPARGALGEEDVKLKISVRSWPVPILRRLPPVQVRKRQLVLLVLIGCIILRVETLRRIYNEVACSWRGVEATLLPILFALYDYLEIREVSLSQDETDQMSQTIFQELATRFYSARIRYFFPSVLLSYGVYLSGKGVLRSTYICSNVGGGFYTVPVSQVLGTLLDALIVLSTWRLFKEVDIGRRVTTAALIVLYSALALIITSIPYALFGPSQASRSLNWQSLSLPSIFIDGITLAAIIYCISYVTSEIRPLALIILLISSCSYALLATSIWSSPKIFSPQPIVANAIGFSFIIFSVELFMKVHRVSEFSKRYSEFTKRVPVWFYLLLLASFVPTEVMILMRTAKVESSHPIFSLMYDARIEGDRWRVQAASSVSFETAVREYRLRHHGRNPPPNFDKWYEFAIARGCPVIDDYDQIDRDLLPFWAMEPGEIRRLSPAQIDGNDVVVVAIRTGKVIYDQYDSLEEQWLPDKIISMIELFSQWLPDMNIGINVRQKPRIAIPWKEVESMRLAALAVKPSTQNKHFSHMLEPDWPTPFLNSQDAKRRVEDIMSEQRRTPGPSPPPIKYPEFDHLICPPTSMFGRYKAWDKYDFCVSCADPHSTGQFVRNWTLAGDLCHQPDMVNLHGFFSSSFKNARRNGDNQGQDALRHFMVPMFSRSKISGYNDILIPGPDDYVSTIEEEFHDNGVSHLTDSLYWAGVADEGDSMSREWQGMLQQRLVHLANNFSAAHEVTLLLPSLDGKKFAYETVPIHEVAQLLHLNVTFSSFKQCGTRDCHEQIEEFGTNDKASSLERGFRYLFDIDAHGASNRFLSYLRSSSVPFRASIFRTWYDDRLTPWLHFVPIDSRLHAIHSTLAYFTGLKGELNGREVQMKNNYLEADFIAGQGRKWAEKALRREDAEAYLFRLFLEWGRLTDDHRDEIGYELGM